MVEMDRYCSYRPNLHWLDSRCYLPDPDSQTPLPSPSEPEPESATEPEVVETIQKEEQ